jgi:serine/threonine-protein kinase
VSRIGRYEIEAEIGRGSMGVVYLAHDPRMQRSVAAKAISVVSQLPADQRKEYQERFVREAHAAGRLSHPGIVTVYDIDWDAERAAPFIAMEYVPGKTLKDLNTEEGPLEPGRACAIVECIADALHAAHEAGVVHRDVKPANILVREGDDRAKIADFGVARLADSELTSVGSAIGSPAYMSPEQIQGEEVGPASDLFSLAVILYEALCGERPFPGEDISSIVYSVVHQDPLPVSALMPGLPPGLDAFFATALAKDPRQRFRDGCTFRRALASARSEGAGPSTTGGPAAEPSTAAADPSAPSPWTGELAAQDVGSAAPRGPLKALVLAFAMVVVILGGLWFIAGDEKAYVELRASSSVPSGSLSLLVDGTEVYNRNLSAPVAKRNLLKKMLRRGEESFEDRIVIPAGAHELVARVSYADGGPVREATLGLNLERGETRAIRLHAARKRNAPLVLRAE